MIEYTWKVLSVSEEGGGMVVEYDHDGIKSQYNLPILEAGEDLRNHVKSFAPVGEWLRRSKTKAKIEVGTSGTEVFIHEPMLPSEDANLAGNWSEEYLRAMIYQVLEEVREASA